MRLKINNTSVHVFEAGVEHYNFGRPSLVFLHYFGGSSGAWTEVIDQLANDYHCVTPDLRGFGCSNGEAESYEFDCYIDDAAALISTLRLENYVLIGHSMGGKIALAVAARRPIGLKSLVLLAPSPPTPEPMPESERKRLSKGHSNRSVAETTVRKITARALPKDVFERTVNDNLRTSEAAWHAWIKRGSRLDISAQIGQINVPVLAAVGEKDELITAKLIEREILNPLDDARLITIPAVKHLLPLEVPTTVADLIREEVEFPLKIFSGGER